MVIGLIDVWGMLQPVLTVGGFLMVAVCLYCIGVDATYRIWLRMRVREREEQERREREEQERRNR